MIADVQIVHHVPAVDQVMLSRIDFTNQATLWTLTNSYIAYSQPSSLSNESSSSSSWHALLAKQMGLSSTNDLARHVDAIVLGIGNHGADFRRIMGRALRHDRAAAEVATGLTSSSNVAQEARVVPRQNYYGPTVQRVAQVFPNTPVFFTALDTDTLGRADAKATEQALQQIHNLSSSRSSKNSNNPLVAWKAYQYAQSLGRDCTAAPKGSPSGDCQKDARTTIAGGHACTGPQGSLVDWMAWDISDFVYQQLV